MEEAGRGREEEEEEEVEEEEEENPIKPKVSLGEVKPFSMTFPTSRSQFKRKMK